MDTNYLSYLLSKRETTSIAVYLFTSFSRQNMRTLKEDDSIHKLYFSIVCDEYFEVRFGNNHNVISADDIVELLICLAKKSIHEMHQDEPNINKDCLDILLNRFSADQIALFSEALLSKIGADNTYDPSRLSTWKYYLLFWLLGNYQDFGISPKHNLVEDLQSAICNLYQKAFKSNFDSPNIAFGPCPMFDNLPWCRIDDNHIMNFINLVPKPESWISKLNSTESKGHHNKRLVRNYFQLLLCLHSKDRSDDISNQINRKIIRILESCGFSEDPNHYLGIFDYELDNEYALWDKFALFIDKIDDHIFERIVDVLKTGIPINRVLEIYRSTSKEARKKIVLEQIKSISNDSIDSLGLKSIEESLAIACQTGQLTLAKELLKAGQSIIDDKNSFLNKKQFAHFFSQKINNWLSYKFKVELLSIVRSESMSTKQKLNSLREKKNPFKKSTQYSLQDDLYKNCDLSQREMIAITLFEETPDIAYQHFDALYKESNNIQDSGNRFASKLSSIDKSHSTNKKYRHALYEWGETIKGFSPQKIGNTFVQNWFHCLLEINDHKKISELWLQLSDRQQSTIEIATCYCRSLKRQGEHHSAKLIFDRLKKHHDVVDLGEEAESLLRELETLIVNGQETMTTAILSKRIAEKPKPIDELRRGYQEIYSKNLSDTVSIIRGKNATVEQFLYDQLKSIIGELQLRKKILNVNSGGKDTASYRIIKEDSINDWTRSLFNHKHSEIGLSYQEHRGGQAPSKMNPGEIDFFVYDKHNNRIAIMEAFRLFANDVTVINDHLNKVAGYDQECLSPVFILAYCDVHNFSTLCDKYHKDSLERKYSEFSKSHLNSELLKRIEGSQTLKIYKEIRYRGSKPIAIYHFMINLRFSDRSL